jgi:hypothetical protein
VLPVDFSLSLKKAKVAPTIRAAAAATAAPDKIIFVFNCGIFIFLHPLSEKFIVYGLWLIVSTSDKLRSP